MAWGWGWAEVLLYGEAYQTDTIATRIPTFWLALSGRATIVQHADGPCMDNALSAGAKAR